VIHIDPVTREAIYGNMPDADLILVTHEHGDHLDMRAIDQILKEGTRVVLTQLCKNLLGDLDATVMKNGDTITIRGIGIEALPAYNIKHKEFKWKPYHPPGTGNAYLLTFGDTRVLIGGDTENIPELKALKDIHVAFLPMDVPFTMTPEMVADLAKAMRPQILYPYHYVNTNPERLVELLKGEQDIEVRIRDLR
jgi:L-ascorbate metabolism protein UlaG (beta-lactamase superfamily)